MFSNNKTVLFFALVVTLALSAFAQATVDADSYSSVATIDIDSHRLMMEDMNMTDDGLDGNYTSEDEEFGKMHESDDHDGHSHDHEDHMSDDSASSTLCRMGSAFVVAGALATAAAL